MLIAISCGHGRKGKGFDLGAVNGTDLNKGDFLHTEEWQANRNLADRIVTLFHSLDEIVEEVTGNLAERAAKVREIKPDFFLSVHHNAYSDPRARGVEAIVRSYSDLLSRRYGAAILKKVCHIVHWDTGIPVFKYRGVKVDERGLIVLQKVPVQIPTVLVEYGFITNPEEERNIRNPNRTLEVAAATVAAICDVDTFLQGRSKSESKSS